MSAVPDARIAELLNRLVPPTVERPDWERVLADADVHDGETGRPALRTWQRKRWPLIAVTMLVLLVVAPLTALAVSQGWWFFSASGLPTPISRVTVVATGTWNQVPWTLTAYRSSTDGVCLALTPRAPSNAHGVGAAMSCDQIAGVPSTPQSKRYTPHRISYLMAAGNGNGTGFPGYITGHVVESAHTVEIVLADHTVIKVDTIGAPSALQSKIRFYIAQLPAGHADVRRVVGRDDHNRIVAHLNVPKLLLTRTFAVSNRGTQVALSAAMKHALRLAHRSTQIRLLASRDGRDFYHLGKHDCYGVGKTVDAATLPPTRPGIGQLAGIVICTLGPPRFPSPLRPVLDLSVYGQNRGQKEVTLFRLAGFASDAVKTVNLLDSHGRILRRVPVIANVYTLKHAPKGVVEIVPADINGKALARCGPGASTRSSGSYLQARC